MKFSKWLESRMSGDGASLHPIHGKFPGYDEIDNRRILDKGDHRPAPHAPYPPLDGNTGQRVDRLYNKWYSAVMDAYEARFPQSKNTMALFDKMRYSETLPHNLFSQAFRRMEDPKKIAASLPAPEEIN